MYMMTFVTLMVALVGLYAQVYVKIAAKTFAQQSGVVDTIRQWHDTAVRLASMDVDKASILAAPAFCFLKESISGTGVPAAGACTTGGENVYVRAATDCTGLSACLPPGYERKYTYYSAVFSVTEGSTTRYYVLTYVPPPPASTDAYRVGVLCLPGFGVGATVTSKCDSAPQHQVHTTFEAFYSELKKNKIIPLESYGIVAQPEDCASKRACLKTQSFTDPVAGLSGPLEYEVPDATEGVPVGSIGIITGITPKQ